MATLTLDIMLMKAKYGHLGETELRRILKEIERRFYDFGKQFPNAQLHERSRARIFSGGFTEDLNRVLELSNIPDEALADAWQTILPAMPDVPALPEHSDDES